MKMGLFLSVKKLSAAWAVGVCAVCFAAALPKPVDTAGLQTRATADSCIRTFVTPARIVWHTDTGVENPDALLLIRGGQTSLDADNLTVLRNNGSNKSGILLDFGVQLNGGVQIVAQAAKNNHAVRVRVRFGESASEAMSETGNGQNATNDHAIRDHVMLIPWMGSSEIGNTGFRFIRIDLDEPDSFVYLKSVRAVFVYRDIEYKGSFRCSDDRLNRIWEVGAYTVHLNMQEYLWDGIKRDRLVWIGDMHPETMAILAVFGANEVVPKSLDFVRDQTPLPKWMNDISSYSMWWILIHHSWYQYTGDKAYLDEQRHYLTQLLEQLSKLVGPDNREMLPEGRFLDWPTRGNDLAVHAGLHALLVTTLEAGAELCQVLDEQQVRQTCLESASRLRKHVPDPEGSKQAAALLALSGLQDARRMNDEVLSVDGARRMSTFYGYYMLQARAAAGDFENTLDVIRQYWGGMLDMGATTFWEDFNVDWLENAARIDELVPKGKKDIHGDYGAHCYKGFRHSLCHGWAAGPTAWMSEHILGIKILEPGCKVVKIAPDLGDLAWAEGAFPTPRGLIQVRHEKAPDGTIKTIVHAPDAVTIIRSAVSAGDMQEDNNGQVFVPSDSK